MAPGKVGIAVPSYEEFYGIKGPYFGDRVFDYLEDRHPGKFEYIPETVKRASDSSQETLTGKNVRERIVYIMHPTIPEIEASTHVMVAQQMADDLLRSDAYRVILFDLYNRYHSYDKRKGRQSLNARIVAENLEGSGIRRVFTIDPHSEELVLAFSSRCPLEGLSALGHLAEAYREGNSLENTTVCAPDIGGYPRAEKVADFLDLPLIGIRKRRSQEKSDETEVLEVVGEKKFVKGRRILFVDDVIRSAGTASTAWDTLHAEPYGAESCHMLATHLELCENAKDLLKERDIKVLGTNTVDHRFTEEERKYIKVIDVSPTMGEVIYRRSEGMSIKQFFKMKPKTGSHRTVVDMKPPEIDNEIQ